MAVQVTQSFRRLRLGGPHFLLFIFIFLILACESKQIISFMRVGVLWHTTCLTHAALLSRSSVSWFLSKGWRYNNNWTVQHFSQVMAEVTYFMPKVYREQLGAAVWHGENSGLVFCGVRREQRDTQALGLGPTEEIEVSKTHTSMMSQSLCDPDSTFLFLGLFS